MLGKLILLLSATSCLGVWQFRDLCAGKPGTVAQIVSWTMPTLIQNGNRYPLTATLNVSRPIPGSAQISVSATRDPDGSGFKTFTKCFGDMGQCSFGVVDRPGHPSVNPLFYAAVGAGAAGYVPQGLHQINTMDFFPGLSGVEIKAVHGSWRSNVTLKDSNGATLGCWSVAFDFGTVPSKC